MKIVPILASKTKYFKFAVTNSLVEHSVYPVMLAKSAQRPMTSLKILCS